MSSEVETVTRTVALEEVGGSTARVLGTLSKDGAHWHFTLEIDRAGTIETHHFESARDLLHYLDGQQTQAAIH